MDPESGRMELHKLVDFAVGDSVSANAKLCRALLAPLVGRRSRRLNLAARLSLGSPDEGGAVDVDLDLDEDQRRRRALVIKADALQRRLRASKSAEALRVSGVNVCPDGVSKARRLSIGSLIDRTDKAASAGLRSIRLSRRAPDDLLLTEGDVAIVGELNDAMAKINAATLLTQKGEHALSQVESRLRAQQEERGVDMLLKGSRLRAERSIDALDERARGSREERELFVRSRSYSFERAVVKTQQGLPVVDREERRAVQRLLRSGPDESASSQREELARKMRQAACGSQPRDWDV